MTHFEMLLDDKKEGQFWDQVMNSVEGQVRYSVYCKVWNHVNRQAWNQVHDQILENLQ